MKIGSLKEDKVVPGAVSIIDSTLRLAGACLASTDLHPPPPQISLRTSWRVYWTFPASKLSSIRSNQDTPTRSPISRGCCKRTWSLSGPRFPDTPRYCLLPLALNEVRWIKSNTDQNVIFIQLVCLINIKWIYACGVGDGPGMGGVRLLGKVSGAAEGGFSWPPCHTTG